MDFFQRQDAARLRTRWLVVLFLIAVVLIVASVYLAVILLLAWSEWVEGIGLWEPRALLWTAGITLAIIASGSLYKIAALSEGGEAVARLLGGRPVDPSTGEPAERRLLNVVEEMSIASGVPTPRVFLLDGEEGINAFAAGFRQEAAVIGVTSGALRHLDRDELQGVMAHEFSHILNGDMRLNLRLMGVLHGILVIAMIGYWILRSTGRSRGGKRGGAGQIALFGLALLAIGYVGLFFGRLIKAAVSRQREFLADASAVQFTRYPRGIGGALLKIGGLASGSKLASPRAEEASHLLFGEGYRPFLGFLLSTHPPLDERVRRILPDWEGRFPRIDPAAAKRAEGSHPAAAALAAGATPAPGAPATRREVPSPREAVERIGRLDTAHMEHTARLLSALPAAVVEAAQDPAGAAAIVVLLLIDEDPEVRRIQQRRLQGELDPPIVRAIRGLGREVRGVSRQARLPLVDLCLPSLRGLSEEQARRLYAAVRLLVTADERIDVFELALQRALAVRLEPISNGRRRPGRLRGIAGLEVEAGRVLATLARYGGVEAEQARAAFAAGVERLGREVPRPAEISLGDLDRALDRLDALRPQDKQRLIEACAEVMLCDRRVSDVEVELLRVVVESLGCPMPPFAAGMEIPAP